MAIQNVEQLAVRQAAHQMVLRIYDETKGFPDAEKFGLISQMRRAAYSVPANISEGFRRRSPADKVYRYDIAEGSLEELRYFLLLSRDLKYRISFEDLNNKAVEIGKMLRGLIRSIEQHTTHERRGGNYKQ